MHTFLLSNNGIIIKTSYHNVCIFYYFDIDIKILKYSTLQHIFILYFYFYIGIHYSYKDYVQILYGYTYNLYTYIYSFSYFEKIQEKTNKKQIKYTHVK